jgi:predicted ArsR family transcriptional regulator
VLDLLRGVDGAATVGEIAELAGLHENTVREHLEGLLATRLVGRERAPAAGRGRPAWRYAARSVRQSTAVRDYLALASVLAGTIARISADPPSAAAEAGAGWGRALVADLPAEADAAAARHRVVQLLSDLGFTPEADPTARTARLTRCPLLDVAREYPEVVCAVHRGIAEAALEALGAPDDAQHVQLVPFAEPGACLLQLGPVGPPA